MMMQDHSNGQIRSVNIWPDNPAGSGAEVMSIDSIGTFLLCLAQTIPTSCTQAQIIYIFLRIVDRHGKQYLPI